MKVNHNNSTIDGWTYTEKGWEPYDLAAATGDERQLLFSEIL